MHTSANQKLHELVKFDKFKKKKKKKKSSVVETLTATAAASPPFPYFYFNTVFFKVNKMFPVFNEAACGFWQRIAFLYHTFDIEIAAMKEFFCIN